MKLLLAPLVKLGTLIEEEKKLVEEIHSVLTVDLKRASTETHKELKQHTVLLGEIRDLLKAQNKQQAESSGKAPKVKLPGLMSGIGAGLAIITMAAALVAAAGIFSVMPSVTPGQLLTAVAIGAVFVVLSPVFTEISESLRGGGLYERIVGGAAGVSSGISGTKELLQNVGGTGLAMLSMAIAVTATAFVFTFMSQPSLAQIGTALLIGLAMIPISFAFGKFYVAMQKNKMGANKNGLMTLAMTGLAMVITAGALVGVAYVLSQMPTVFNNPPPLEWTLKVGLALFVFSLPFTKTMKAIKGRSIKEIAFAALALPLIAAGILGTAWIFNYLSEVGAYNAPPIEWTLKAGLAMAVFGIPFVLVTTLIQRAGIGFKAMVKGSLATVLIAGAILATAWIFSFLPGEYISPPVDWALSAGIALAIFAVPFAIVGLLAQVLTPVGLGLGALGMILIAGTMWVVAWIFSTLPDLSAISKNFTDAIIYPVNSMIDALKRFKDEIGIENMLPLAGGLLAIAGGWLALTAALAGSAVGGVIGAAANVGKAIFDGISRLFGGDDSLTPISLLEQLINKSAGIEKLGKALPKIGTSFATIAGYSDSVVRGIGAFIPFLDEDMSEYFTDSATAATTLATAYQKIGKATETMNVEAIKESRYMFEALTRLAEADGEDALTIFAEKLMVAVEELSGTVENLQNAVGEQSTGIKDVVGGLLNKVTDKVKEVTGAAGDQPTTETSNDMSEVVELLSEIEERLNRPLRIIAD